MHPFDSIIREVLPGERNRVGGPGRHVFMYDPRHGTAKPYRPSWLGSVLGAQEYRYYVVTEEGDIACPPIGVELTDAANQRHLVEVVLTVQALEKGRESDAVAAVARE